MIHSGICHSSVSRDWGPFNYKCIVSCTTKVAAVTACAAAIFASAYSAYQNSRQWGLMAVSVGFINFCALPQFLRHGSVIMLRLALVVNLVTISSLSLGAMSGWSLSLIQSTLISLKTNPISQLLLSRFLIKAFLVTGLIGYGMPLFQETLKRAYGLLQEHKLRDYFAMFQEQFRRQSKVESFLAVNLRKNFMLHLALFKPNWVLELCRTFNIAIPHDIWPMIMIALGTIDLEQFKQMLLDLGSLMEKLEWEPSEEMQEGYHLSLKIALRSLKQEDRLQAIPILISYRTTFIPRILSEEQFLQLFTADVLSTADAEMQNFLNLIHTWRDRANQYESFKIKLIQVNQDIEAARLIEDVNQRDRQLQSIDQHYRQLHQEYSQLRVDVEKIYFSRRIWQDLATLPNETLNSLFEHNRDLARVLNHQQLWKEIEEIYHSLFGVGKDFKFNVEKDVPPAPPSVHTQIERLSHHITSMHPNEEKEPLSAVMYLATNQGFIQRDYDRLQTWLGLSSPHDLEAALAEFGLETEADLYKIGILNRRDNQSKEDIFNRLYQHIRTAPKLKITHHVQPKEEINPKSALYQVTEKVSQFIFYAISGGLLLVPFFVQPHPAKMGLGIGLGFFILKRFGFPGTRTITNRGNIFLNDFPMWRELINRRIFLFTPQRRERAHQFFQANLFERMRIINTQLHTTVFFCRFSFLQGLALADRIVDSI